MNKTKEKGKNRRQKTEVRHLISENGIIGFKQDAQMIDVET